MWLRGGGLESDTSKFKFQCCYRQTVTPNTYTDLSKFLWTADSRLWRRDLYSRSSGLGTQLCVLVSFITGQNRQCLLVSVGALGLATLSPGLILLLRAVLCSFTLPKTCLCCVLCFWSLDVSCLFSIENSHILISVFFGSLLLSVRKENVWESLVSSGEERSD